MREIKFRGKRTNNGEWVYGDFNRYSEDESTITVDLLEQEVHWVQTETIGQYTGLKDKNGREIYEGDVVLMECHATFQTKRQVMFHKCEVVFDIDFHGWRFPIIDIPDLPGGVKRAAQGFFRMGYRGNQVEVIGNIHEQKEGKDND